MIKRGAIGISLILPCIWLIVSALFPSLDLLIEVPLLHFYIVTFFTFAATVVAFLTAVALEQVKQIRHRLLATAYVAMGSVFSFTV